MKRLIVSICLLTALVIGCFWSYGSLNRMTQSLADQVAAADKLLEAGDENGSYAALQESYQLWRQRQQSLGALVRHNELDEIENLFLRAMQSLDDDELNEYRLHSRELQGMLRHIPEMELPTIQNIF